MSPALAVFTTEPPGTPPGLSPSDEPTTPSRPLSVIWATPLRCPHPPPTAPGGGLDPVGSPTPRKGLGPAFPGHHSVWKPPCSQARSRGLFERGVPGRGWMWEDPGGGQSPGPSGAGGRGARHQPFPRGLSGARHPRSDPTGGCTGCGTGLQKGWSQTRYLRRSWKDRLPGRMRGEGIAWKVTREFLGLTSPEL